MATSAVWSDLDIELSRRNDGDIQRDTEVSAILNSLRNIIETRQYSRRMYQTFASNIHSLLFEPIDEITARTIAERLLYAIEYWEDRITVTGFDIEPRYDENMYRCRLAFNITGTNKNETIDFIISR